MKSAENGGARIIGLRHGDVIRPQSNPLVFIHQETPDSAAMSPEGVAKVRRNLKAAKERKLFRRKVVIFSSERPRTLHSATIAKVILDCDDLKISPLLNNRHMQDTIDNYQLARTNDKRVFRQISPEKDWELEARTVTFIDLALREHKDKDILIVSHAENLAIAQAHLLQLPQELRSDLKFEYGEIRRLSDRPNSKFRF